MPAPWGLVEHGPQVTVTVGHNADYMGIEDLRPEVFPVCKMLIDTGAAFTLIEEDIAVKLGFRPIRYREVIGVDQKPTMRPVFRLSIGLEMGDGLGNERVVVFREDVVGMPRPTRTESSVGLLGRDFLSHFVLGFDGPNARYSLSYYSRT
ncbi:MAG: hypothetical protein ACI9WU_004256 [Myxococcota bacterium]|jgi:hypothetical protein